MEDDKYLMFKSFSVSYYYSILFGWMPIRIPKDDNDKVFCFINGDHMIVIMFVLF